MILVSGGPSFKRNSCMEKMKIYTLLGKVLNRMNLVSISETIGKKSLKEWQSDVILESSVISGLLLSPAICVAW